MLSPDLQAIVVYAHLSGISRKDMVDLTGVSMKEIESYVETLTFLNLVSQAKKDMASSVVDRIKERLHAYITEMEGLALNPGDPRVRFQALKDLLDRGGTGATQKMALTSPSAYRKVVEEFLDVKVGGTNSNPDSDHSGVQHPVPESD